MRLFIKIIVFVIVEAANWLMFKKMGREGWEGIIPLYNAYVLFQELYGNGWKFLLLLIPLYNVYVAIRFCIDLAMAFNQKGGFAAGLILVFPVFSCILGYDKNIVYHNGMMANNNPDVVSELAERIFGR